MRVTLFKVREDAADAISRVLGAARVEPASILRGWVFLMSEVSLQGLGARAVG